MVTAIGRTTVTPSVTTVTRIFDHRAYLGLSQISGRPSGPNVKITVQITTWLLTMVRTAGGRPASIVRGAGGGAGEDTAGNWCGESRSSVCPDIVPPKVLSACARGYASLGHPEGKANGASRLWAVRPPIVLLDRKLRFQFDRYRIDLGSQDEVVLAQPADCMRPELNRDVAISGDV